VKHKIKLWFIGGAVGAVAVLAALAVCVFATVRSGLFLSTSDKVLAAAANTLSDGSYLAEALEPLAILSSDSYTVGLQAETKDEDIDVQYSVKKSERQLSGNLGLTGIPDIDILAQIDASQLKIQLPDVDDRVFVYGYATEKTGYLPEVLGAGQIEKLDRFCQSLYSGKECREEMGAILFRQYDTLPFQKTAGAKYEVDGKSRFCKGYQVTITAEQFHSLARELRELTENQYEAFDFDSLYDKLESMPDVDMTFYICQNKLACISVAEEGEVFQVLFQTGEDGMLDIEVVSEERGTILKLYRSINGTQENYTLENGDSQLASLEYDYQSGAFTLEMGSGRNELYAAGEMRSDSKSFSLTVEECEYRKVGTEGAIYVNQGAAFQKLAGEEFDLGEASASDLQKLIRDIAFALYFKS
jgi:hypothetical protein